MRGHERFYTGFWTGPKPRVLAPCMGKAEAMPSTVGAWGQMVKCRAGSFECLESLSLQFSDVTPPLTLPSRLAAGTRTCPGRWPRAPPPRGTWCTWWGPAWQRAWWPRCWGWWNGCGRRRRSAGGRSSERWVLLVGARQHLALTDSGWRGGLQAGGSFGVVVWLWRKPRDPSWPRAAWPGNVQFARWARRGVAADTFHGARVHARAYGSACVGQRRSICAAIHTI